jgi:hypothetical protein
MGFFWGYDAVSGAYFEAEKVDETVKVQTKLNSIYNDYDSIKISGKHGQGFRKSGMSNALSNEYTIKDLSYSFDYIKNMKSENGHSYGYLSSGMTPNINSNYELRSTTYDMEAIPSKLTKKE